MTDQEKLRHEAEARTVMMWPREKRTEYYAMVKKNRGHEATQKLIDEVNRQWQIKTACTHSEG